MTTTLPTTDTIDSAQLRELMAQRPDLRILDVRTGGEFETVHIAGSYNVPLDTLEEHVADLADVAHPVVLVCRSGGRASTAHTTLRSAGKDALHILEGGMIAWEASGGDVVRGETQRWAMDRQVRLVAGSLVLIGVLASLLWAPLLIIAGGVAAGLVWSAVSDTCAMANMLARLPYNKTDDCDIAGVLHELSADAA